MARGVLGQVVDYDQGVLPAIAKILGHSECREWGDPLQSRRTRRTGHHDDTSLRSAERGDCVDDTTDAGTLLANCDVDAEHVARLLIDDRVDRDRSLAGRAVGSRISVATGPLPSSGRPSGSTIRPRSAGPTGTRTTSPVPRTLSPAWIVFTSSNMTQPTRPRSSTWAKPN